MRFLTPILFTALLISGCATIPEFDTSGVDMKLDPMQVSATPQEAIGHKVIWGGMILSAVNFSNSTQLEVLAYPLNDNHRPNPDAKPLGRFLVRQAGYLETQEYAEGRFVSIQGRITGARPGLIGETEYRYPVVEAEKLFLWPKNFQDSEPKFHFGIGVMVGG